jgi:dipeptidyl aminopeptidase/acylaminoacyl peptidase
MAPDPHNVGSPDSSAPLPPALERQFTSSFDGSGQTFLICQPPGPARGVLVYLHGAGAHQDQGVAEETYLDSFTFIRRWAAARGWAYVCPEYRGTSWMNQAAEADVVQILDMAQDWPPGVRPLLMGGSMGGTSALIFASRHPGRLAGVLALCPATDMVQRYHAGMLAQGIRDAYGGTPHEKPAMYAERSSIHHVAALAGLPVCLIHADKDVVIDVSHSRSMARALERQGSRVLYVEIPGGHDAPITPQLVGRGLDWLTSAT